MSKERAALKNYKLKFSRLSTCFSMIVNLAATPVPVEPGHVIMLARQTPQERFAALAGREPELDRLLHRMSDLYRAFLVTVQQPRQELLEELSANERRRELLSSATTYGAAIHELLLRVTPAERLRYLVV